MIGFVKSTVERIAKMIESCDDVNIHCQRRCGRKRKTTASGDKMLIRNSVKVPWEISRKLQSDLTVSGVTIDPSTV